MMLLISIKCFFLSRYDDEPPEPEIEVCTDALNVPLVDDDAH